MSVRICLWSEAVQDTEAKIHELRRLAAKYLHRQGADTIVRLARGNDNILYEKLQLRFTDKFPLSSSSICFLNFRCERYQHNFWAQRDVNENSPESQPVKVIESSEIGQNLTKHPTYKD